MMFLLDTDSCIFWLRGHEHVHRRLAEVGVGSIAISTITLAELYYGAECSARSAENLQAIEDFMSEATILEVSPEVARRFGEIKADLRRQGNLIEDFDLLLAATALALDMTLVTNNLNHFGRIPQLITDNWVAA